MRIIESDVKFISLLNDTTFKYLFKSNETRPFINHLLEIVLGYDISCFYIINGEHSAGGNGKNIRQDILLSDNPMDPKHGRLINVEMYRSYNDSCRLKSDHYLTTILYSMQKEGETYFQKYVTQVNFYNTKFSKNKNEKSINYRMRDKLSKYEKDFSTIIDVYLESYEKSMYNEISNDEAIFAFLRAESYEEMEIIAHGREEMMNVVKNLKKLAVTDEFIGAYDAEDEFKRWLATEREQGEADGLARGRAEGLTQGLSQGKAQEKMETAKNMLGLGMDVSTIHNVTNMPVSKIKKLKI